MTIASEITRIQTNIEGAYTALNEKGATMPDVQNSANLASTIESVPRGGGEDENIPEGYFKTVFVDYDGTILSEQLVPAGGDAVPPEVPQHEDLEFTGWNRNYTSVLEHQLIGACYSIPHYTVEYIVDLDDQHLEQFFYFTYGINNSSEFSYEAYVDWGDGNREELTDLIQYDDIYMHSIPITHVYNTPGIYKIVSYFKTNCTNNNNTEYAKPGVLTKSEVIENKKWDNRLINSGISNTDSTIKLEYFNELKELRLSSEMYRYTHDMFIAPNLEKILYSSNKPFYSNTIEANYFSIHCTVNTYDYINMININKIKHITIPNNFNFSFTLIHADALESVSYGDSSTSASLKLSYCINIRKIYNMTTMLANKGVTGFEYHEFGNLHLENLDSLSMLYNTYAHTTSSSLQNYYIYKCHNLKKIKIQRNVQIKQCYGLREVEVSDQYIYSDSLLSKPRYNMLSECTSVSIIPDDYYIEQDNISYNDGSCSALLTGVLDFTGYLSTRIGLSLNEDITYYTENKLLYKTGYSNVIIPSNITSLNLSFKEMHNLKEVIIPDELEYISLYNVLYKCPLIEKFIFNSDAKSPSNAIIQSQIAYNCSSLKKLQISNNLNAKTYLIYKCPSLQNIWLPSNVTLNLSATTMGIFGYQSSSIFDMYKNVVIYTDAESKPDTWSDNWNILYNDNTATVVWGASYQDFLDA